MGRLLVAGHPERQVGLVGGVPAVRPVGAVRVMAASPAPARPARLLYLAPPPARRRVPWRLAVEVALTLALACAAWALTGTPVAAVSYLVGAAVTLALLRPRMVPRTGSR